MMRPSTRPERGFTLIELLLAVAILGIILATVGLSVTQGFRTTTATRARVDRSNLTEFTAKVFTPDVASASGVPTVYPAPITTACGAGGVLDLPQGSEYVQYAVLTSAHATELVRRRCDAAGVVSERTIGRTNAAFTAVTGCRPDTVTCRAVTLTLTWAGSEPHTITLRAERRAQ